MDSLTECIASTHRSLLERVEVLDSLLNWLPSDRHDERSRAATRLRGLVPEIEGLLTRCRYDEQDLFASGVDLPLFQREQQRADQEELQVLLEIVEAESWRLHSAPAIGFLCLLRSLGLRIRQHVEHEQEVLAEVASHAEAALSVN
jgi:hypothetical protein